MRLGLLTAPFPRSSLDEVADWTASDPRDFVSQMSIYQSPDTLAAWYGVPLWSERHQRHVDPGGCGREFRGRPRKREDGLPPLLIEPDISQHHAFRADHGRYQGLRIQPRVAALAAERDVLEETCRAAAGRGLGVNAWTVGSAFTWTGVAHVTPSSADCVKAMPS